MTDKVLEYVETAKRALEGLESHLSMVVSEVSDIEEKEGRFPMTSALRASAAHALNELYVFFEAWDIYRYVLHSVKGEAALAEIRDYKDGDADEAD